MRHISDLIVHVVHLAIDRHSAVGAAKHQEHKQLNARVLHFVPVLYMKPWREINADYKITEAIFRFAMTDANDNLP